MPLQNVYKTQNTGLAPDVVRRPDPVDQFTPAAIEQLGNDVTQGINTATLEKANEGLTIAQTMKEQQAASGLDAYKDKLYQAAAAQDQETFGQFYAEAQKLRTATIQGIMSPSQAQLRLNKLEKDLAYAHPQLAGDLRAAGSAIGGNASQLVAMVKDDPASKAMEELFKESFKQGMTPNEYMAFNRKTAMVELGEKEMTLASKTRAYTSQQYVAQLGRAWGHQNTIDAITFLGGLEQEMRAAGGMIPGADLKAKIIDYRNQLRSKREQEIFAIVRDNPNLDLQEATKMLDNQLAWLDSYAATMDQGTSFTFEHMAAMKSYAKLSMELEDKIEFRGWTQGLGLSPFFTKLFADHPQAVVPFIVNSVEAAAASKYSPNSLKDAGWIKSNPEAAIGHAIFGNTGPQGAARLEYVLGKGVANLMGVGGAEFRHQDESLNQATADLTIKQFETLPFEMQAEAAVNIWTAPEITTSKVASSNNDGLFMHIRSNPVALERLYNQTRDEVFTSIRDYVPYVQLGGGDPRIAPFQMRSGATPGMGINKALEAANKVMRNYAQINPHGYMEFMDQLRIDINGEPSNSNGQE